jgi:uncharacterized protein YfaQ (DUF2300 family)
LYESEPRPSHTGGSVSANASAGDAAFVFACGASVCAAATRIMLFVIAVAAFEGVWQRRKSRSFHLEAGAAFVEAAFADASLAASDMRSPLEINNASPPANAAVQAVKSDIRERINAFIMSSNQSARSASMRVSLG